MQKINFYAFYMKAYSQNTNSVNILLTLLKELNKVLKIPNKLKTTPNTSLRHWHGK
jgi:hypothetical protein